MTKLASVAAVQRNFSPLPRVSGGQHPRQYKQAQEEIVQPRSQWPPRLINLDSLKTACQATPLGHSSLFATGQTPAARRSAAQQLPLLTL